MNGDTADALNALREARNRLARPNTPSKVDLRRYVSPGSPAWNAFVDTHRVPGYSVKRATMIRWLDEVIGKLDGAVLDLQASEHVAAAPLPPATSAPAAPATSPRPVTTGGTPLRQLTEVGIEYARELLAHLREHPDGDRKPPHDLLFGDLYSRVFANDVRVEPRAFRTRREAGAYLSPLLAPIRNRIADHAGVWSWLGMYYFEQTSAPLAGRKRATASEAFVFSSDESTTEKRRSYQRRYRHWLRGSWRLYEQHRDDAAFLLDEDITTFNDLADRTFSDFRVFNSVGVVPLAIALYTDGERLKPNYPRSPGGLRHLLRVLPQLELTHDVYGMEPDALLEVLPPAFHKWRT